MKIKELLELCKDNYCNISVYDESSFSRNLYRHTGMVNEKYGYFPLVSWSIQNGILHINTRTQF